MTLILSDHKTLKPLYLPLQEIDCSGCLSPELASNLGGSVTTDIVTHCVGK